MKHRRGERYTSDQYITGAQNETSFPGFHWRSSLRKRSSFLPPQEMVSKYHKCHTLSSSLHVSGPAYLTMKSLCRPLRRSGHHPKIADAQRLLRFCLIFDTVVHPSASRGHGFHDQLTIPTDRSDGNRGCLFQSGLKSRNLIFGPAHGFDRSMRMDARLGARAMRRHLQRHDQLHPRQANEVELPVQLFLENATRILHSPAGSLPGNAEVQAHGRSTFAFHRRHCHADLLGPFEIPPWLADNPCDIGGRAPRLPRLLGPMVVRVRETVGHVRRRRECRRALPTYEDLGCSTQTRRRLLEPCFERKGRRGSRLLDRSRFCTLCTLTCLIRLSLKSLWVLAGMLKIAGVEWDNFAGGLALRDGRMRRWNTNECILGAFPA